MRTLTFIFAGLLIGAIAGCRSTAPAEAVASPALLAAVATPIAAALPEIRYYVIADT